MGRLVLVTPPEPAVALADAKAHMHVDADDDDAMIEGFIRAATEKLDGPKGLLRRALMLQTWDLLLDAFPRAEIEIPLVPLRTVTSVTYSDVNGDEQTIATDAYTVDNSDEPGWVIPNVTGWPSTLKAVNVVRIRFTAGNDAGDVPESLLLAIKQHVAHMYEHRESVTEVSNLSEVPQSYHDLIRDYRTWVF